MMHPILWNGSGGGTPERIITLYEGALDASIASGINPVDAVITRGGNTVAEYMQMQAGEIGIVGTPRETNIEAVIGLSPDLILASSFTTEEQYKLLSRVASTIVPNVPTFQADSWKKETRLFAKALGRPEAGEQSITQVENRVSEVAHLVDDTVETSQRKTALLRGMPQGLLVMAEGLFSASLLKAVGFNVDNAGIVKDGRPHSHPLSQENLGLIDHQWVFLAALNADGKEALGAAQTSPAFQRMQANRSDCVVTVNGQLWTSASGPIAALKILDNIADALNTRPVVTVALFLKIPWVNQSLPIANYFESIIVFFHRCEYPLYQTMSLHVENLPFRLGRLFCIALVWCARYSCPDICRPPPKNERLPAAVI